MRAKMCVESADIYKLPRRTSPAEATREITIGDLHANAMKLMYMLIKEGVVTGMTDKMYVDELVDIYRKPVAELTAEDLSRFNTILDSLQYNQAFIRLIGDELADRGSNDYFTLLILKKLQEKGIPFEILASNHSMEFLFAQKHVAKRGIFRAATLREDHSRSLNNLQHLISKELVSVEDISKITVETYQPNLKIVSYSLDENCSEITLYSHAAIDLETLVALAKKLEVPYQDETIFALAQTIDNINDKFQEKTSKGVFTLSTLCPSESLKTAYCGMVDLRDEPVVFALWNRRYDFLKRPPEHQGYKLCYVHGHDSCGPNDDYILNLDKTNDLGKTEVDPRTGKIIENNKGNPYFVLYSKRSVLSSQISRDFQVHVVDRERAAPAGFFKDGEVMDTKCLESDSTTLIPEQEKIFSSKALLLFKSQLKALKDKETYFKNQGKSAIEKTVRELHNRLHDSYTNTLLKSQNVVQFKRECFDVIDEFRPPLENHRGSKLILSYLALAVTGIGLLVVFADVGYKLTTKKHFSFFQTDTAKKISALEKGLKEITFLNGISSAAMHGPSVECK